MKSKIYSMRIFLRVLVISLLFQTKMTGQATYTCGVQNGAHRSVGQSSSNQPTNCIQFLKDFVPSATDSVLEVRLKFYIFKPSSGNGTWGNNTNTDAQHLIQRLDSLYSHISAPVLTVSPLPAHITHARIKFVMVGNVNYVVNQSVYNDVSTASPTYYDPTAINVYYGGAIFNGFDNNGDTSWFDRANANFGTYVSLIKGKPGSTLTKDMDGNEYVHATAHEIGHFLGLEHSDYDNTYVCDGATYIPGLGCCDTICANDYVLENPPGYSNNGMMSGGGYFAYLSPQQMAITHYHLRTQLKWVLSTKGYNDATKVNPSSDYNVTADETWTSDRFFKGNVTVKAGKVLTVKCLVAMTKDARITVEKTALLVIDGGTITSVFDRTWDGIYVWGDDTLSQAVNAGMPSFQGMLKMINGATISHAVIGARNHRNPWTEYGGIIQAANSNFYDNYIDVQQTGSTSNQTFLSSVSRFINCNFKTVTKVGDIYSPLRHVNLYNSVGVRFYNCTFECAATATVNGNPGIGIYSGNSVFYVDKNGSSPCVFKKLYYGIHVNNSNVMRVPVISNSKFEGNLRYAGYFLKANYLALQTNTIQATVNQSEGIYLNQCKYYKVKNNQFTNTSGTSVMGLAVFASGAGSHEVFRNTFSNHYVGINVMDNNGNSADGLKMNCNVFNETANQFDIAMTYTSSYNPPTVMAIQGATLFPSAFNVVRNIYGATCVTGQQNKWYINSSSSQQITHGANTNTSTAVTQPASNCKNSNVHVFNTNIPLNYTLHCSGSPPSSGGTGTTQSQRLSNLNEYLSTLRATNTDGVNHFEIQSTVSSKINLFLTDTLGPQMDSVIDMLENNYGEMEDADIQTVFAYLAKGEYTAAQVKVDNLSSARNDWAELLTKVIAIEQYTVDGVYGLNSNSTDREFLIDYATTAGMDGQAIAQALLKQACDSNYTEPHTVPEVDGERSGNVTDVTSATIAENITRIYPNPTNSGINVSYLSTSVDQVIIEIRDLLGKTIYTKFSNGSSVTYFPLNELSKGMYLVILTKDKTVVHSEKLIKE